MNGRMRWLAVGAVFLTACGEGTRPVAPVVSAPNTSLADASGGTLVYTNFGAGMSYDPDPAQCWSIYDYLGPSTGQQAISQRFVPAANYALRDATIAIRHLWLPDSLKLFVHKDSSGLPGPVLESIPVGGFGLGTVTVTGISRTAPVLRAGTPYWLSVTGGSPGVLSCWMFNATGDLSNANMASTYTGLPSGPWVTIQPLPRGVFQVRGTPPAYGRKAISLDAVSPLSPTTIDIDGSPFYFQPTISNRTSTRRGGVSVEAIIEQGSTRRKGGEQAVSCGTEPSVLPPGTCVGMTASVVANASSPGIGSFVAGNATVIIRLVQTSATGSRQVLDAKSLPVTLRGGGLSVTPSIYAVAVGRSAALTVSGVSAPTDVTWSSSDPAAAAVSSTGLVTGISTPLPFTVTSATITATSKADPSKASSMTLFVYALPFVSPSGPTVVSTGASSPSVNPLSATVAVRHTDFSSFSPNPYTRIDFQVLIGATWTTFATLPSPTSVTDNGVFREFTWTTTFTPGPSFPNGAASLRAAAYHASGAPVISQVNSNITITTP